MGRDIIAGQNNRIDLKDGKAGLVFSGGGTKGAYEIGCWRGLQNLGLDSLITGVSGSSIGAFNSALFLMGSQSKADSIWRTLTNQEFINLNMNKIDGKFEAAKGLTAREAFLQNVNFGELGQSAKQLAFGTLQSILNGEKPELGKNARDYMVWMAANLFGDGFATPDRLIELLDQVVPEDCFSEGLLGKDYFSTVCSWNPKEQVSGKARYIRWNGRSKAMILRIIAASMSLPVLYPHGEHENHYYVDGGYADNIPILPLYHEGYRNIIVIYLDKFTGRSRSKRIALEDKLFPGANIMRVFPGKGFDYSFAKSCSVNAERIACNLELGCRDVMEQLGKLI